MLMITGANGWEHAQWQGTYYPSEIAKDWHLSYYIKDFQTVLAPISLWENSSIEEIKEFCSDVDEAYPLIFERNGDESENTDSNKKQLINDIAPNIVIFKDDGWKKVENGFEIKEAEITKNTNLLENCGVFSVHSSEKLKKDIVLTEIMKKIKEECKQYEVTYVYFDGELAAIDSLNTVTTLRRHLALD